MMPDIECFSATACPPPRRSMPFGVAVVPEVYSRYSTSIASASTGRASGSTPGLMSRQRRSRPGVIGQGTSPSLASPKSPSPSLSTTSTCAGRAPPSSSATASSTSGLYAIVRPPSTAYRVVTTTRGLESAMRVASWLGAKPPKTMECTAPSFAHASAAAAASGVDGM